MTAGRRVAALGTSLQRQESHQYQQGSRREELVVAKRAPWLYGRRRRAWIAVGSGRFARRRCCPTGRGGCCRTSTRFSVCRYRCAVSFLTWTHLFQKALEKLFRRDFQNRARCPPPWCSLGKGDQHVVGANTDTFYRHSEKGYPGTGPRSTDLTYRQPAQEGICVAACSHEKR